MLKEVHTNKIANKISLTDFEVQFSQCLRFLVKLVSSSFTETIRLLVFCLKSYFFIINKIQIRNFLVLLFESSLLYFVTFTMLLFI